MFSCSSDNLTIPHDSDPPGNDVLTIVGGHLDVHLPSIALKIGGHIDIAQSVPEVADFSFAGVHHSCKLVNVVVGFGEPLVSDCYASMHCGDEAVCDGVCGVIEVITVLHVEEGLS